MLKIGHFKHLNKLKKQLLKHRIQIINIREKTSYSKIDHPSDTLALKVPEPDDGTEWISPELPEYLQIRQKLRSSSEDFFRDMSMMPFEARFREDLEKEHYYKYDFEGDLSAEAQFASKMTFGTGSQKAGLLRKRIESKILGMFDTETPLKALRQLKVLVPYLGVKEFIFLYF